MERCSWSNRRQPACSSSAAGIVAPGFRSPQGAPLTISVFLLDDHEIVRRGIGQLLETVGDIQVVGETGSVAQAMARLPALRPDVAVLDVRLPDGDGIAVCRDIRSSVGPSPACLMLTSYSDEEALFGAISSLPHKLGLTRRTEAAVCAVRRRTERINDRR
jgi:CheY-like chemotaxis protein